MCFYQRTDYSCSDWKWGNMKEQCPRERRTGETCGARLSHIESRIELPQPCRTCTDIATKKRRLARAQNNITRWGREGVNPASREKCESEARELEAQIRKLEGGRASNVHRRPRGGSPESMPVPSITGTFFPPRISMDGRGDAFRCSGYVLQGTCV